MAVLLVTGSRGLDDTERIARELDAFHAATPIARLVHGGALGVDRLAGAWATARQIPVTVHAPDYSTGMGRGAPLARNAEMVAIATDVVAFWDGKSHGTRHCIGCARAAGKLRAVHSMTLKQ